jgi:hypothetical protein
VTDRAGVDTLLEGSLSAGGWVTEEGAEVIVRFHCKSAGKWQVQVELELPYYRDLEVHFWKECTASQWSWQRLALGYCLRRLVLAGAGVYLAVYGLEGMKRLGKPSGAKEEANLTSEPEMMSLVRKSETTF